MKMDYHKVIEHLKSYSLSEPPYDPNGAMHLLKAIVENLQEYYIDHDLEQYAACFDAKNELFIKKLLTYIPISREIEIQENFDD